MEQNSKPQITRILASRELFTALVRARRALLRSRSLSINSLFSQGAIPIDTPPGGFFSSGYTQQGLRVGARRGSRLVDGRGLVVMDLAGGRFALERTLGHLETAKNGLFIQTDGSGGYNCSGKNAVGDRPAIHVR